MSTPTMMICPKCHGQMASYERNGITIDQCTECRGIFLDRGELDRLVDAEAAYSTRGEQTQTGQEYQQPRYRERDHDDDDHHHHSRDKRHRRRGGFLGELFD
jgi:Zn-finger nucleic acid-binding protein